jgi:hypothetical protein
MERRSEVEVIVGVNASSEVEKHNDVHRVNLEHFFALDSPRIIKNGPFTIENEVFL